MEDKNKFVQKFADQFEDTDASLFSFDTEFREIDEWSSLIALSIMAMCEEEYNVILSANEMEEANKISDIYDIVNSRNCD